jgi:hypothetical protein
VIAQRDHERAREFLQSTEPPWEDRAFAVHTWMRRSSEELAELVLEIERCCSAGDVAPSRTTASNDAPSSRSPGGFPAEP